MNTLITMLEHSVAVRIGWSLVHLLWQGMLVGLLLAGVLWLLRRRSANARYLCAGGALLSLPVLFVVTFATIEVREDRVHAFNAVAAQSVPTLDVQPAADAERNTDIGDWTDFSMPSPDTNVGRLRFHNDENDEEPPPALVSGTHVESERQESETGDEPTSLASQLSAGIEPVLPWVVGGWLLGFALLSLWHAGGWIALRRLRTWGTSPVNRDIGERFDALCNRLGLRRPIELLRSTRVTVPSLIGMLKPVVLLPVGVLTGLTPQQLEAVLAHELAHVRRHDFLANLLQTAIETLLFFHPAVWWMSRRIRIERENCCDDIALQALNDPVLYAKSLTRLEELRHGTSRAPALSLAASGGSLLDRIHRVLGLPRRKPRRLQMSAFGLSGIAGLLALVAASLFVVPASVEDAPAEMQEAKKNMSNEWHPLIKGRLATVSVHQALYETKTGKYFLARVRVTNQSKQNIGVDLRGRQGIRINQWGASAAKQRGIIDEARAIRDPFKATDKARLTTAFRNKKLQMIPAGKSIDFYRAFNGRDVDSVRKAVDAAKGKYLILSMDGEVRVTNGTAAEVLGCGEPGNADVVIEQPVTWKTVPANARVLPRDLVAHSDDTPTALESLVAASDRIVVATTPWKGEHRGRIFLRPTRSIKGRHRADGGGEEVYPIKGMAPPPADKTTQRVFFLRSVEEGNSVARLTPAATADWHQPYSDALIAKIRQAIPMPKSWSAPLRGLAMGLRLRGDSFKPGAEVPVEVFLKNVSNKPLDVMHHRYNIYDYWPHLQFEVTAPDGSRRGLAKPVGPMNEVDFPGGRTLQPGESYIHVVRLNLWPAYQPKQGDKALGFFAKGGKNIFVKPGKYTLRAVYSVPKLKAKVSHWQGRITSPAVGLTVVAKPRPKVIKQVKSPEDRGKLSDAVMKINGERNKADAVVVAAGPKPKPGVKSLSAWYYQTRKGNELADDRETWVLFRSKQMNDNDRMWVHSIKREDNTFTITMQRKIWSGEYFENLTFHKVHGINLGKLAVGKYAVNWVIGNTGFKEFDKQGWPKPLPAIFSRSVDKVSQSFVVNAAPNRKVPQPAKWNPRAEKRPKPALHDTIRGPTYSRADDFYRAKPLEQMPGGDIRHPEARWFAINRKAKYTVTTKDNNWLLFRTKQADDRVKTWVTGIERKGKTFTIRMTRSIWSGAYTYNITYHDLIGINLGKLPAGKYTAKWIIDQATHTKFDKENWPTNGGIVKKKAVELSTAFTVVAAGGKPAKPAAKVLKQVKTSKDRGKLRDAYQKSRNRKKTTHDEFLRATHPADRIYSYIDLDGWFDVNKKSKKRHLTTGDNNWLMFRSKQVDDQVKSWVTANERNGDPFTIRMTRSVWTGNYTVNITYHDVIGVNLGKLPAGKYKAKWIIDRASHKEFDKENWPTDDAIIKKQEVELLTSFVVVDAKKDAADRKRTALEKKDLATLNGTWEVQHTIINGKKVAPTFEHYRWTINAKAKSITTDWKLAGLPPKGRRLKNRFSLNVLKSPKQLTVTGARLRLNCIYEFKEKTLRIGMFGRAELGRPKSFDHTEVGKDAGPLVVFVLKRKEKPKPKVQRGAIRAVDSKTKIAWINLGSVDNLKVKTTFEVRDAPRFPGIPGAVHGTVEVTRIVGPHLAEARIVRESAKNPIRAGDAATSVVRKK